MSTFSRILTRSPNSACLSPCSTLFRASPSHFHNQNAFRTTFKQSSVFSHSRRYYHIVFFGTDRFALETLKALHKSCLRPGNPDDSLHVITPPDTTHMRTKVVHPVKKYAMRHGLPFVDVPHERKWPRDLKDLREFIGSSQIVDSEALAAHEGSEDRKSAPAIPLRQIRPEEIPPSFDIGVVVSFRYLVPQFIVQQFKVGAFNIHPSDLPKYRGPAPLVWTVANGETDTRISFIQLFSKFDHGTIVHQSPPIAIPPDELHSDLYDRIGKMGAVMAAQFINGHSEEEMTRLLQMSVEEDPSTGKSTTIEYPFAPKINQEKHCGVSFLHNTATEIYNKWRAFSQQWNVHTIVNDKVLHLLNVSRVKNAEDLHDLCDKFPDAAPGEVVYDKPKKCVYVRCNGDSWLELLEVQYAGRRRTQAEGFAAGMQLRHHQKKMLSGLV